MARNWLRSPRADALSRSRGGNWWECGHCGLVACETAIEADTLEKHLAERMRAAVFQLADDDPLFVEAYALRTVALRHRKVAVPTDNRQRAALHEPYAPVGAAAALHDLASIQPVPVSLTILCRNDEIKALRETLAELAEAFDDILLLVDDSGPKPERIAVPGVRVVERSLDGDFAAQRNHAQKAARHAWVLQLDSDETLDPTALGDLARVAAVAERSGSISVGLPRRNVVDGVLSDLFPDVQYRLNRRQVRYVGRVHERPALPRGWRDGFIAPNLVLHHSLSAERVRSRSTRYEALSPGEGRLFEAEALLRPFRP
ncbi:glycosyltransferase [Pararhizobium mangrovi]|uniref:Glycosyltransferase n=1 Tax=Pararhizobium mangrovi TaxID=2590452 RepID=A0A506U2Y4_9HYPH|nr:glycosyltransferase [Pararhizobium mangrovi]TPW28170.1 glycosyltransferase [Pararhizobium mangrovi]